MKTAQFLVRICGFAASVLALFGCEGLYDESGDPSDPELVPIRADLSMLVRADGCDDALERIRERIILEMEKAVDANLEKAIEKLHSEVQCQHTYDYDYGGASPSYSMSGAAGASYSPPSGGAAGSGSYSPTTSAPGSTSTPTTNPVVSEDEASKSATDYSTTNTQVVGVDEADFVKNDGSYIYILADGKLQIIDAWPAAQSHEVGAVAIAGDPKKLYVHGDVAVVYSSQSDLYFGSTSGSYYGSGVASQSGTSSGLENECTYGYSCEFSGDGRSLKITVFDISDRSNPKLVRDIQLNGAYLNSRRIGNIVHTVAAFPEIPITSLSYLPQELRGYLSSCWEANEFRYSEKIVRAMFSLLKMQNKERIMALPISTFLPRITDTSYANGLPEADDGLLESCGNFYIAQTGDGRGFLTLLSFDLSETAPMSATTIIGKPGAVYASTDALYVAVRHYASTMADWFYDDVDVIPEATSMHKFALSPDSIETGYVGSGVTKGRILNQFSMDEHDGYLRIATTTGRLPNPDAHNTLSVLSEESNTLRVIGMVDNIAPSEDIRSVRFNGDVGFIVTFKKTDPLFVLDLSDPSEPVIKGELKIPGFSTYMHLLDESHLLTIGYDADDQGSFAWFQGVQLQIIDVSDLTNPLLVHKKVIGTRGSTSEAATNHLAFNYFPERSLLAIPMTICDGSGTGGTYGDLMTFSGLLVYNVTIEDGFRRVGGVPHKEPETETTYSGACNNWWTDSNSIIQRSVFMGDESEDFVYSIAFDSIDVASLEDLENPLIKVNLVD